jgi:hypothetical protein
MMQTATVFFPIYEAYKASQLRKTLATVESWEENRNIGESNSEYSRPTTGHGSFSAKAASSNASGRRREMYSMAALEKALAMNPTPLLYFAASKEFTGENIAFLIQVRDWRAAWHRAVRDFGTVTGQVRYSLFSLAANIFATSIHTKTAEFPINVEGKIRTRLEAIFAPAVSYTKQLDENNVIDPFNRHSVSSIRLKPMQSLPSRSDWDNSEPRHSDFKHSASQSQESILPYVTTDVVKSTADIPVEFDERIFDDAEQSIKYMVVTNTWPKFVDSYKEHESLTGNRMR